MFYFLNLKVHVLLLYRCEQIMVKSTKIHRENGLRGNMTIPALTSTVCLQNV